MVTVDVNQTYCGVHFAVSINTRSLYRTPETRGKILDFIYSSYKVSLPGGAAALLSFEGFQDVVQTKQQQQQQTQGDATQLGDARGQGPW